MRVKSKKSIDFGKFAEYECEMMAIIKECEDCPVIRREQFVIDSGYTFKLKCLPNGKFQSPSWQKCRQPMPCELTPPYPPSSSGLVPYNPYEYRSNYTMMIREFSDVRYECKDEKKVCISIGISDVTTMEVLFFMPFYIYVHITDSERNYRWSISSWMQEKRKMASG